MAQIVKILNVDVARKNRFQALVAKQFDSKARYLKVQLQNEGVDIVVDANSTVIINARRADGESKGYAGSVNEDGTVTVPITSWMLGLDDVVVCDISVIDSSARKLTTMSFEIEVDPASYSGEDIADDDNYDLLVALLSDVADATAGVQEATAAATQAAQFAQQAMNTAYAAAENANGVASHLPTISTDGYWMLWDTEEGAYTKTEHYAGNSVGITTEQVPFTETGQQVACTPVEGTALSVTATIPFTQAGSGDPSLTNVRNISGVENLTVTRSEDNSQLTAAIGQAFAAAKFGWTAGTLPSGVTVTVADGSVDFSTGSMSVSKWLLNLPVSAMSNGENYPGWKFTSAIAVQLFGSVGTSTVSATDGVFTIGGTSFTTNFAGRISINTNGGNLYLPKSYYNLTESQWKEQYPDVVLQLCWTLNAPETVTLTAQTMTAIAGTNTLSANCGTLTVSGIKQQQTVTPPATQTPVSPLNGKKIAVLGDSISSTDYERPNWWELISAKTGVEFISYAISGTSLAHVAALETTKGACFVNRYTQMDAAADGVIVMGGTNDAYKSPIGAWDSTDTSTFYGALNTLIPGLLNRYPSKPILFCTMIQTQNGYTGNVADPVGALAALSATAVTGNRQLLAEAIKAKCRQYSIPCLDLYNESGITGVVMENGSAIYYRTGDSLHPSAAGQKHLAELILRKMKELL